MRRASADGPAGARREPGSAHGDCETLGVIAAGGDAEDRAAAAGEIPVDAGDHCSGALEGVSQGRVGTAGGRLERAAHQAADGGLAGFEEPRQPRVLCFEAQAVVSSRLVQAMLLGLSMLKRQRQRVGKMMSLKVESVAAERMGRAPLVREEVSGQRRMPEEGASA